MKEEGNVEGRDGERRKGGREVGRKEGSNE